MPRKVTGMPLPTSSAYIAGAALFANGPCTNDDVHLLANFGATPALRAAALKRAITMGWLVDIAGGLVTVSPRARHHYAGTEPDPRPTGGLATPRSNVNAMRTLSAKYRLNPRGLRPDAWDNSMRAIPSHHAKVAP